MAFDYEVKFDKDSIIHRLGLEDNGEVQQYITETVMTLSDPYVPYDEAKKYADPGMLRDSAHIENDTEIVWNTPYARRWYYEPANFQGAPIRGNHWVDRAMQNGGLKAIEDGVRKIVGGKE